jgi:hypothetical protein
VEDVVEQIVLRSPLLSGCASDEAAVSAAEVSRQRAQRADDQATLEQLARDHYSERLISRAEFLAARKPLQERIAAAERAIDQAALPRHKVHPDPEEAWRGMDIEDRRNGSRRASRTSQSGRQRALGATASTRRASRS